MSAAYVSVQWNRQKRWYDTVLLSVTSLFLILFVAVSKSLFPLMTDEILLMRAFGSAAFLLLHGLLCIGPLCRFDRRFLPLLYNRRHAGVTCFFLGAIHAVLVLVTYHGGGDVNPIKSVFAFTPLRASPGAVPFQALGFIALCILFLMAATSHDFWLANLTAPVWKALHMSVYIAYGLLVLHVTFGVLQAETSSVMAVLAGAGLVLVLGLHLAAGLKETRGNPSPGRLSALPAAPVQSISTTSPSSGFVDVCSVEEIPENRAHVACLSGEHVAIFRYEGRISAVSGVCQHQNGPLGEGRIVHGCITCPWHGYQYRPENGAAPAPFSEKVPTFRVQVREDRVWVDPKPLPAGTHVEPALIGKSDKAA